MTYDLPKSKDLPVTVGMFFSFKDELIALLNSKFSEMNSRFEKIDARFEQVDARFEKMESRMSLLESKQHQMLVLMETQKNENMYALDAARHAMEEVKSLHKRVDDLEFR